MVVFLIAIFAGIPGAVIINKIFLYKRSIVSLIILGTFAIGQAWIGLEIILRKIINKSKILKIINIIYSQIDFSFL